MPLLIQHADLLKGSVAIPASKSQHIRALFFALLANGSSKLHHPLEAEDTATAGAVCQALGAEITQQPGCWSLTSPGLPIQVRQRRIHTGNSGITTCFTLPILGLRQDPAHAIELHCGTQMQTRSITPLIEALNQLGMQIQPISRANPWPLSIWGSLKGSGPRSNGKGAVTLPGQNSQYTSALLISLPCAPEDSILRVIDLHERPYVEMTLRFLASQSIHFGHERQDGVDVFEIPGRQSYSPLEIILPGDFSSASCLIAAAVLCPGQVYLTGLNGSDLQGDKRLIPILQDMGADITLASDGWVIQGGQPLQGQVIDARDIPDLVPALAVVGTQALGETRIQGVPQARCKETDRLHAMAVGLRRMGAKITEHADGLTIVPRPLHGAAVDGCADHRTVMALTVAGLVANGVTRVSDPDAIQKTYPLFIEALQSLGAPIQMVEWPSVRPTLDETSVVPHIILIGFKHVGKTTLGRCLAEVLQKPFIDLDDALLEHVRAVHSTVYSSCRELYQAYGETDYRALESRVLAALLSSASSPPCVIALGGGARLDGFERTLLTPHRILHVTAHPHVVYARIMKSGIPAFFGESPDPRTTFHALWQKRLPGYAEWAEATANNDGPIENTLAAALKVLNRHV